MQVGRHAWSRMWLDAVDNAETMSELNFLLSLGQTPEQSPPGEDAGARPGAEPPLEQSPPVQADEKKNDQRQTLAQLRKSWTASSDFTLPVVCCFMKQLDSFIYDLCLNIMKEKGYDNIEVAETGKNGSLELFAKKLEGIELLFWGTVARVPSKNALPVRS